MDELGERLRSRLGGARRYVLGEEECTYVYEMLMRNEELERENEGLAGALRRLVDSIEGWEEAVKAITGRDPRVPWDDLDAARPEGQR